MIQNVRAVANFDMLFSYVLAGWEGSAYDSKVLDDARMKGLPNLPGKFYLGDAGYALSCKVLTPYRGLWYHLKEWALGNRMRKRYIIFGVEKKRFPILVEMSPYALCIPIPMRSCAVCYDVA